MANQGSDGSKPSIDKPKGKKRKKPMEVRDAMEERYFNQPAGSVLPSIADIAADVKAGRTTVEQALD